jgi:hypothetical protein
MESRTTAGRAQCEDGCGRSAVTNGRCKSHHWAWYRKQETDDLNRQCLIGWCKRVRVSRGRCHSHYGNFKHQLQRHGQWPPTEAQVAQQDAADRARLTKDPVLAPPVPVVESRACLDCLPGWAIVADHPDEPRKVLVVLHADSCPDLLADEREHGRVFLKAEVLDEVPPPRRPDRP